MENFNNIDELLDFAACETPTGWREFLKSYFIAAKDVYDNKMTEGERQQFQYVQIKEKFGRLRICHNMYTPELEKIDNFYEDVSEHICYKCGRWTNKMTTGWIVPVCEECSKEM